MLCWLAKMPGSGDICGSITAKTSTKLMHNAISKYEISEKMLFSLASNLKRLTYWNCAPESHKYISLSVIARFVSGIG